MMVYVYFVFGLVLSLAGMTRAVFSNRLPFEKDRSNWEGKRDWMFPYRIWIAWALWMTAIIIGCVAFGRAREEGVDLYTGLPCVLAMAFSIAELVLLPGLLLWRPIRLFCSEAWQVLAK